LQSDTILYGVNEFPWLLDTGEDERQQKESQNSARGILILLKDHV